MEELKARVELVEKSLTDATKGLDQELPDSLKLAAKEAR